MDVHPTPFPGNKGQPVKSKYKKTSEAPKQKTKHVPLQTNRRTFGMVRNPNVPEKTLPQKPKTKPSNQIHIKQVKQPNTDLANESPQNGSNDREKLRKKKTVSFPEKIEKNSPAKEIDVVKTPVRPSFSVKPVKIPGTPYLSAEKCSSCRFDRLETASYWLGQIKSAESVGKHFVAAAFFRLASDCKAEPVKNLQTELKRYLTRHECLSTATEWEDVSRMYGILKKEHGARNGEEIMSSFYEKTVARSGSKLGDAGVVQEQSVTNENGLGERNT